MMTYEHKIKVWAAPTTCGPSGYHLIRGNVAAGLWLTASVGVAVGLGRETSAILGTVVALIILALLPHVRSYADAPETPREDEVP